MIKIGKPFNQLTKSEYFPIIKNHKQYSDFNTLGLYRSLLENEHLTLSDQLEIRELAHGYFQKTFDFLQLKDPVTYMKVAHLGKELTRQEEMSFWEIIRKNQERILKEKRIKHRNFGAYSKHNCGYDYCPYNGVMIKQGSPLAEMAVCFATDKNKDGRKQKAHRLKKERQEWKQRAS